MFASRFRLPRVLHLPVTTSDVLCMGGKDVTTPARFVVSFLMNARRLVRINEADENRISRGWEFSGGGCGVGQCV